MIVFYGAWPHARVCLVPRLFRHSVPQLTRTSCAVEVEAIASEYVHLATHRHDSVVRTDGGRSAGVGDG